jgi:sec-independent protein translocase protein TatA
MLVFGTKKLRNVGSDIGGAVKGFREGLKEASDDKSAAAPPQAAPGQIIEGEIKEKVKS